jgi:hypothetical protein
MTLQFPYYFIPLLFSAVELVDIAALVELLDETRVDKFRRLDGSPWGLCVKAIGPAAVWKFNGQ